MRQDDNKKSHYVFFWLAALSQMIFTITAPGIVTEWPGAISPDLIRFERFKMELLTSETDYQNTKFRDLVTLRCQKCLRPFQIPKYRVYQAKQGYKNSAAKFCSIACTRSRVTVSCETCGVQFSKEPNQIKKTKHNFCSQSCAGFYNNRNRTTGLRRSKNELYFVNLLKKDFPHLLILENNHYVIPSGFEIDIYIPKIHLAIELNGPVHYLPIFGTEKLNAIQKIDAIKKGQIETLGIKYLVIDTSKTNKKGMNQLLNTIYETEIKPYLKF